jgi:hypothetical protein
VKISLIPVLVAIVAVAGCSSAPPTIQEGPNAEVSFDGLHAVDNSAFQNAWADPDADFSRYKEIMPGGAFFEFRAAKKTGASYVSNSTAKEFYIPDANKEKLKEAANEIFQEEMAKSTRFTMTESPGADVLIIRGGLHDIMSRVPPQSAGRSDVYLSSVGEATLILEVVDSMSDEVIFRAVERRAAESATGGMQANSVTTWSEVRRMLRRWATTLTRGLDSIPTE